MHHILYYRMSIKLPVKDKMVIYLNFSTNVNRV